MAKPTPVYWDSCAWLGLLNKENDKRGALEIIYNQAKEGKYDLWTSTISTIEVNRLSVEKGLAKPLSDDELKKIEMFFNQPFIKMVPLDVPTANYARRLLRETAGLTKKNDSAHLATALRRSITPLHTYDQSDLLHLNNAFQCANGEPLEIIFPDETVYGPLFARGSTNS